jgi:hypothetical protein
MYFVVKSGNQSQNSTKGPCEDAGGNIYKSIYIHSKTSPISIYPERPLNMEDTAPKPPLKSQITVCNCTWGQIWYFLEKCPLVCETKI